jgi:endoglycosylceramidase
MTTGALWAAVEPEKDKVDMSWFNKMDEIIDKAGSQYGIYTLLDGHQDAWAQKFCGTGVPDYVAAYGGNNFPIPLTNEPVPVDPSTGYPNRTVCDSINDNNWPMFQFTRAISQAVGCLYNGVDGLDLRYAKYWGAVASFFAKSPYVVGYELLNEPW